MALLNKDIKDVEFSQSLRSLGNIRVLEWDFRTVLPAVSKLAHQEVDVIGLVKRTACYKVMEWDFRTALKPASSSSIIRTPQSSARTAAPTS